MKFEMYFLFFIVLGSYADMLVQWRNDTNYQIILMKPSQLCQVKENTKDNNAENKGNDAQIVGACRG